MDGDLVKIGGDLPSPGGGDLLSIGGMARASGLSVSALRFYDGAGVLMPAEVDRSTGYRWYATEQIGPARMVAGLRRVGMPLAEITEVLGHRADPPAVRRLLDAHLRRLEDGLADARRELSRVHALLDQVELPRATATRLTVPGSTLAAAYDAVRFAVSNAADLPMLNGVLIEVESDGLRLVATDRYRLAVAGAAAGQVAGHPARALVPVALFDQVRTLLVDDEPVTVTVAPDTIIFETLEQRLTAVPLDYDFPDYRRLLGDQVRGHGARRVTVDVAALREALAPGVAPTVVREQDGVPYDVAVLAVDDAGTLAVVGEEAVFGLEPTAGPGGPGGPGTSVAGYVGVNREFLLDALDAGGQAQLVLELDGPIRPLAIRPPTDERTFSILMPVRLS